MASLSITGVQVNSLFPSISKNLVAESKTEIKSISNPKQKGKAKKKKERKKERDKEKGWPTLIEDEAVPSVDSAEQEPQGSVFRLEMQKENNIRLLVTCYSMILIQLLNYWIILFFSFFDWELYFSSY